MWIKYKPPPKNCRLTSLLRHTCTCQLQTSVTDIQVKRYTLSYLCFHDTKILHYYVDSDYKISITVFAPGLEDSKHYKLYLLYTKIKN